MLKLTQSFFSLSFTSLTNCESQFDQVPVAETAADTQYNSFTSNNKVSIVCLSSVLRLELSDILCIS